MSRVLAEIPDIEPAFVCGSKIRIDEFKVNISIVELEDMFVTPMYVKIESIVTRKSSRIEEFVRRAINSPARVVKIGEMYEG